MRTDTGWKLKIKVEKPA
ncbi:unnamed protein product, partial [Rotaria sp. Silwood1]